MTRSIHLPIAPANEKTCGAVNGPYETRCPRARHTSDGHSFACRVFGTHMYLAQKNGRLQRWPECIAAEVET